jgi:rare lipoprotein A
MINISLSRIILIVFMFLNMAFDSNAQEIQIGQTFKGKSSYYGKEFIGRKTSNGEILKADSFTCAHRTLPFGTMLEVENLKTGKWVVVRVNDRGPFSRDRILDLSFAAASKIGMMQAGILTVSVMIVGKNGEVIFRRDPPIEDLIENALPQNLNEKVDIPLKNKNKVL